MIDVELTKSELEAVEKVVQGKVEFMRNFDKDDMTQEGKEHFENLKSFYEKIEDLE